MIEPGNVDSIPGDGTVWGPLKPNWVQEMGKKSFYAYGCLLYSDVFNRTHWLTFCGQWQDDIKAFGNCQSGDATGDGNGPKKE